MKKVTMNKDIRKNKAKLIAVFSARETLCIICGTLVTFLVKNTFFKNVSLTSDVMGYITIACYIPFVIIGWGKIYGLYIEDFFAPLYQTIFSPKVRKYDNKINNPIKKHKTKKSKNKELQPIK